MKRKAEKAYFNDLWDEMETSLEDFLQNGEQEKLHRFRVQVKKLRALLLLLDTVLGQKDLTKMFRPVKKIFKHGGAIREAYINIQLSSHYDLKNDDFIQEQVNGMEKAIIEFRDNGKKHLKTVKEVHDELEDELQAIDDEQVSEFYRKELEEIAMALGANEFGDELHDCRKRIKNLVYNRKVAGKSLEGALDINNDYLDKLQGEIGEWHDTILAIALFSSAKLNAQPVVNRIQRQHTRLKNSIKKLSADFWKRATYAGNEFPNTSGS